MCYGSNCKYEIKGGPNWGDCSKPANRVCPEDYTECSGCADFFLTDDLDINGLCEDCLKDEVTEYAQLAEKLIK